MKAGIDTFRRGLVYATKPPPARESHVRSPARYVRKRTPSEDGVRARALNCRASAHHASQQAGRDGGKRWCGPAMRRQRGGKGGAHLGCLLGNVAEGSGSSCLKESLISIKVTPRRLDLEEDVEDAHVT